MKQANFWVTTFGTGVVIAGMITASHSAVQSPTLLFLAGQLKIAAGQTQDGMRLMNQAAALRGSENGKVHAAEPVKQPEKDTHVCTKDTTVNAGPRPAIVRDAKFLVPEHRKPVAIMAKLEIPSTPFTPPDTAVPFVNPATLRYMSEAERAQMIQAEVEVRMVQRERAKELRRAAKAINFKYSPETSGFTQQMHVPVPPESVGQMAE